MAMRSEDLMLHHRLRNTRTEGEQDGQRANPSLTNTIQYGHGIRALREAPGDKLAEGAAGSV